ncbi:hypothetical protein [Nocardioides halotolerans]|jgi:hypothetical protein|uniref:hypothetical protein n=1 Tax=Nocardioides halotolerans TaxID=433660 RepID=UPI0003FEC5BE|nr:hypothetical protein [Nocardioides halotolerans]
MFIQVMQARCTRHDELRALADEWAERSGPDADGWLGGTYGFTDDDLFFGVIRFTDRDSAMANSARPETSAFAERMAALVDGPVEFHDSDDVSVLFDGGSDDAGFVQIIRGKVDDPARLRALLSSDPEALHQMRPDILGATLAIEADGTFTETVAFTDEDSARRGEATPPPPEVAGEFEWAMQGASFHDLRQPWFESPR